MNRNRAPNLRTRKSLSWNGPPSVRPRLPSARDEVALREFRIGDVPAPDDVDDRIVTISQATFHASTLLQALRAQDVHAASVFPVAHGIAEQVREVYLTAPLAQPPEFQLDEERTRGMGTERL